MHKDAAIKGKPLADTMGNDKQHADENNWNGKETHSFVFFYQPLRKNTVGSLLPLENKTHNKSKQQTKS